MLLTRGINGREIVQRRCAQGAMAGVRAGLDLAQARALLPPGAAVHVEAHRPDRDQESLHRLACWALRIAPRVAPNPPDGLLLEITGTGRLYGSERRLARSSARALARLGFGARVVIAPTFTCASAMAKWGEKPLEVVRDGEQRRALAGLPVAALSDDAQTLQGMAELGMQRVEQVMALSRAQIVTRFGLPVLAWIDRAMGDATETINPVSAPPPIRAEMMFDGPTDHYESVQAAAHIVLGDLAKQLSERTLGVRRLECDVLRPRAAPERVVVELSRASANLKHVWGMLRTKLEKIDLSVMVEGLVMTAARTARLRDRQTVHQDLGGQEESGARAAAIGELTDTLVNRLGPDRVVRRVLHASHLPERGFGEHSVMEAITPSALMPRRDRPTVLFDEPLPAEVIALTPDGPVMELGWIGSGGVREIVVACIGPERIGPEWWRWRGTLDAPRCSAPPPDRDYFAVQLASGVWLWVCRQVERSGDGAGGGDGGGRGGGRWFVHGEWG